MSGPHRFSAHHVLNAILAYRKREGEYPSQRALSVEAEKSLAHTNSQVALLVKQGYVKLSKSGGRIIEAHAETPQEKADAQPI
jgi:hypothetical protein